MDIKERQSALRAEYAADPRRPLLTLSVQSVPSDPRDPLHCAISPRSVPSEEWRSGAHAAVGGEGDAPCSADLLLAALAACQEITLRIVAANHGLELTDVHVVAEGDWDPRGTLAMGREFPVGLTAIRCTASVSLAGDVDDERAARFLRSAERYCVVLATLRSPPPIESRLEII
jgi:uncharacterized OsmC-like protein